MALLKMMCVNIIPVCCPQPTKPGPVWLCRQFYFCQAASMQVSILPIGPCYMKQFFTSHFPSIFYLAFVKGCSCLLLCLEHSWLQKTTFCISSCISSLECSCMSITQRTRRLYLQRGGFPYC